MENSSSASCSNTVIVENGSDPPDVPPTKSSTENRVEDGVGKEDKKVEEENRCLDETKDELDEKKGLDVLMDGVGKKEVEEGKDVQNKKSVDQGDSGYEKDSGKAEEGEENKGLTELRDLKGPEDGEEQKEVGQTEEQKEVGQTEEQKEKESICESAHMDGQKDEREAGDDHSKEDVGEIEEVDEKKNVIKTKHLEGLKDANVCKEEENKDRKEEKGIGETKDEGGKKVVEEIKYGDEKSAVKAAVNSTRNSVAEVMEDIRVKNNVKASDNVKDVNQKNGNRDIKGTGQKEVVEEGKAPMVDSKMELLKDSEYKQGAQGISADKQKSVLGDENNLGNISKAIKDKGVKAKKKHEEILKVKPDNVKKKVIVDEDTKENVSSSGLEEVKDGDVENEDVFEEEDDGGDAEKKSGTSKVAAPFKKKREKVKNKDEVKGKHEAKEKKGSGGKPEEILSTTDTSLTHVVTSRERPVRERKVVERLVEVIEKEPNRAITIEKGRGTPLKDIPNVAYKISRKKPVDLKFLHQTLFGRRGKLVDFKSHILQFSGFAWHESEEKQRARLREKLDKCVKDELLDFCDLLDLTVSRASTKKEEIVVKLLDFLEAPHATTDVILAEKEQSEKSKKRKRSARSSTSRSAGSTSGKKSSRKRRAKSDGRPLSKGKSPLDTKDEDVEEETENGAPDEEDDAPRRSDSDAKENESSEASHHDDTNEDDDEDSGEGKRNMVQTPEKQNTSIRERRRTGSNSKKVSLQIEAKSLEAPSSSKQSKAKKDDAREKVFARRIKNENESPEAIDDDDDESEDVNHLGKRNEDIKQPPQQHGSSVSKKRKRVGSNSKKASSQTVAKSPVKAPSSSKQRKIEKDVTGEKVFTRKKKDADSPKKSNSKPALKDNTSGKKSGKENATSEEQQKSGPSKSDLRKMICETLKEVDFNTATFTDILKKLAAHYKMDLTPKKAAIKQMIQEELTKMADEAEDSEEEDEEAEDAGKEEIPKPAAKKVKA